MINVMKITHDDNVYNSKRDFKVSVARVAQRQSNGVLYLEVVGSIMVEKIFL